jgi:GH24 family phage-related lysozyme (muramidase)
MKVSPQGLEFIINLHGYYCHAHRGEDTNLVIGCHHILKASEKKYNSICTPRKEINWRNGLLAEYIRYILEDDLAQIVNDINYSMANTYCQHEFDALSALIFDIGRYDFLNSEIRRLLNLGDKKQAIKNWGFWATSPEDKAIRDKELKLFMLARYV